MSSCLGKSNAGSWRYHFRIKKKYLEIEYPHFQQTIVVFPI
jgi:hypothetical protein